VRAASECAPKGDETIAEQMEQMHARQHSKPNENLGNTNNH
jgi:hypothetical protein